MTETVSATLDQIRTPARAAGALDSPMLPPWAGPFPDHLTARLGAA